MPTLMQTSQLEASHAGANGGDVVLELGQVQEMQLYEQEVGKDSRGPIETGPALHTIALTNADKRLTNVDKHRRNVDSQRFVARIRTSQSGQRQCAASRAR